MARQNYGIVGNPLVTVTMFTTIEEDLDLSMTDTGRPFPDAQVTQRRRNKHYESLKTQGAEGARIFPIAV